MKVLIRFLYAIRIISYIATFSLLSMEEENLENYFDDALSSFNLLNNENKFKISLYYLNLILKENPNIEEINSNKAIKYLTEHHDFYDSLNIKKNPNTLKVILKIEEISKKNSEAEQSLVIYKLIFERIKDSKIKEILPHPDLFNSDRTVKKTYFNKKTLYN